MKVFKVKVPQGWVVAVAQDSSQATALAQEEGWKADGVTAEVTGVKTEWASPQIIMTLAHGDLLVP